MHGRPKARLCSGRLLLLGGGTTLLSPGPGGHSESLEAVAIRKLPVGLRAYALTESPPLPYPPSLAPGEEDTLGESDRRDDQWLMAVAERCIRTPVTCLAGTADHLTRFLNHVRSCTGRERITDVWPGLTGVLHARGPGDSERLRLASAIADPRVLLVEMYCRPEGAVALEDPRHGMLRLLPDHGIYFEFVPVDQVGRPRPERKSAAEVQLGVPYALALSSPAGIWACLVGSVVRFERRDPPLLQVVETSKLWQKAAAPEPSAKEIIPLLSPFPAQPPHRRTAVMAATPRGRYVHTAW